jgi:hypothetical protein
MVFFDPDAVLDHIDGDVGVDIAQGVQVHVEVGVDLDDVLLAHFAAGGVFDDGNRAVQLVQLQEIVDSHALTGLDMVDHNAVFNGINVHAATSRSFRIRAMRINLPLSACLK